MKQNMGNADRIVRVLIALLIGVLYFSHSITGWLAYILLGIAAIFIVTSFVAFCPLYSVFGIKTCAVKDKA